MLLFKKSCTLFTIPNISKHSLTSYEVPCHSLFYSLSMPWLVCLLLQSLNTVYQSAVGLLFHDSLYDILFVQMVVHSLSRRLYIFSPSIPVISFHIKGKLILVYIYQLHCPLLGLFDTVLSSKGQPL